MQKEIVFTVKQKWLILIGASLASFLGCMDFTIVNTALPAIGVNLHTSIEQLQWVINIFVLALSSSMVVVGRLADIYGRRLVLYIGLGFFTAASLLAGCASDIQWLIFWRLIQGLSCAVLYTASGAITSNAFAVEERGRAMGILFGASFTGLAAGPVLGGLIVGALGWRWVFFVNVPVAISCLIICLTSIPESKNTSDNRKIDYLGALLLMLSVAALVLVLTQGEIWGWGSYRTILLFLFAVATLILLYIVEEKTDFPIIKFDLFINRGFISSIVATFFLAFFYCVAFFLMPLYLHGIRGESDYIVGLMLLPTTIMVAAVSPFVGKYVDRRGPYKPLILGFILFIISALLQANFTASSSLFVVLTAFVFVGIAWGIIVSPSTLLAISSLPKDSEALAIGTSWTMHNIGGAVGLSIGVAVYNFQLKHHNNVFLSGYKGAMLLLVTSSIFALIIIVWNAYKKNN